MLELSDTPISQTVEELTSRAVDASFLVPTKTGMEKSIMDAIAPLRHYLKKHGIHDYDRQGQGQENKKTVKAYFVQPGGLEETSVSLYKPNTKSGDPRIWFRALKKYAGEGNLLAVVAHEGVLYVANCSNLEIRNSVGTKGTSTEFLGLSSEEAPGDVASDLLSKLRNIASNGWIQSVTPGDTGVGMTLEDALGIAPNASKLPDFNGIEIKSSRLTQGRRTKNRSTLFSQVPDWKLSPVGSGYKLLEACGYNRGGRLQLYCTVDTRRPNSQGLVFSLDRDANRLNNHLRKNGRDTLLTTWEVDRLHKRLETKHRETFWVKADFKSINGKECFLFNEVIHTRSPSIEMFDTLLKDGIITMDYTLSLKETNKVRDHGYLFKIWPDYLSALFPAPRHYTLTKQIIN